MCAPTVESSKNDDVKSSPKAEETSTHRGFLFGTISLALVVTASAVTMGHMQSRRDSLGCDTMCVGSMTSARSTLTLIGSTIVGRSSDSKALDKFGGARKVFLFVGIIASFMELAISSQASSIEYLWISMIPSALFQQNFNILKALFGEYHDESASAAERAGSVGKLGMAVGLAFMIGPLASSTFFHTYEQAALFAVLCLTLAFVSVSLLPPPTKVEIKDDNKSKETNSTNSSSSMTSIFKSLMPDFVPAARTARLRTPHSCDCDFL